MFSPLEQFESGTILVSVTVKAADATFNFFYLSGIFLTAAYVAALLYLVFGYPLALKGGVGIRVVAAPRSTARGFTFVFRSLEGFLVDNLSMRAAVLQVFFPLVGGCCFLVLISNFGGVLPLTQVFTGSLIGILFISVSAFGGIISWGSITHGYKALGLLLPPGCPRLLAPFIVCVETVSYLARILSLAVRLFANMTAGHSLLSILATFGFDLVFRSFSSIFLGIIPLALLSAVMILEVAVAFLQAYVFVLLLCLFLRETFLLH